MSEIAAFQLEQYHRLKSDPVCSQVSIILQTVGDIENDVSRALGVLNEGEGGKIGACIIVLMPSVEVTERNVPGPLFDLLGQVRVLESPLFNDPEQGGTGLTADVLAERVLHVLHYCLARGTGGTLIAERRAIEPYDNDLASGIVGYDVNTRRQSGLASGDKVAIPSINGTAEAVTLACATSGAAIYYTTDGSYPGSGNEAAQLYSAAFAVAAGATVRAGAEKPGADMVPSDTMARTF